MLPFFNFTRFVNFYQSFLSHLNVFTDLWKWQAAFCCHMLFIVKTEHEFGLKEWKQHKFFFWDCGRAYEWAKVCVCRVQMNILRLREKSKFRETRKIIPSRESSIQFDFMLMFRGSVSVLIDQKIRMLNIYIEIQWWTKCTYIFHGKSWIINHQHNILICFKLAHVHHHDFYCYKFNTQIFKCIVTHSLLLRQALSIY